MSVPPKTSLYSDWVARTVAGRAAAGFHGAVLPYTGEQHVRYMAGGGCNHPRIMTETQVYCDCRTHDPVVAPGAGESTGVPSRRISRS